MENTDMTWNKAHPMTEWKPTTSFWWALLAFSSSSCWLVSWGMRAGRGNRQQMVCTGPRYFFFCWDSYSRGFPHTKTFLLRAYFNSNWELISTVIHRFLDKITTGQGKLLMICICAFSLLMACKQTQRSFSGSQKIPIFRCNFLLTPSAACTWEGLLSEHASVVIKNSPDGAKIYHYVNTFASNTCGRVTSSAHPI